MKVWIDGAIVDGAQARVPVTDHGLLYGDGVFEGIRCYGGGVFRLEDHLERFECSARAIGLALPGRATLREIVLATARALGQPESYLRLITTRGEGPLGVDPLLCPKPRTFCIADQIQLFDAERQARGLDLITSSVRRPASDVLDPRVKSLNYLNNVLAKREARLRGADDALVLNQRGQIAEAAVANVFCFRHGVLRTPPATDGALEGITRDSVLKLATQIGVPAVEQSLGRIDLFGADEVFLTGTGARIIAVRSLDGEPVGGGRRGALTEKLAIAFREWAPGQGTPFL